MLPFKPVIFISDWLIFLFLAIAILVFFRTLKKAHWRQAWKKLLYQPVAVFSGMILVFYFAIAICDSIHFLPKLPQSNIYSATSESVLDEIFKPLSSENETTYSKPWATHSLTLTWYQDAKGVIHGYYPPLDFKGVKYLARDLVYVALMAIALVLLFYAVLSWFCKWRWQLTWSKTQQLIWQGNALFPYRTFLATATVCIIIICFIAAFCFHYHILGTDKVGNDVFYESIKSIRTGLLIGSITMLFMLPLAMVFGIVAGYFGGKTDDLIQYIYTTISSIPGILLIAASVLSIQVFISNHPHFFSSISQQADLRLIALCLILGLTGWVGLCRILRAETLKLRETDYVAAAQTLGSRWPRIMTSHILPNVMHLIIVTIILDFSGLVLAEAVLTYVGVGVDPSTISWGNMIDAARMELAREPVVWWPLTAAFCFMFTFVLALNLFGDALRNALDPRSEV
ncbi:MAG: ABC transporter permease [Gammaproteobacteria bacterium]